MIRNVRSSDSSYRAVFFINIPRIMGRIRIPGIFVFRFSPIPIAPVGITYIKQINRNKHKNNYHVNARSLVESLKSMFIWDEKKTLLYFNFCCEDLFYFSWSDKIANMKLYLYENSILTKKFYFAKNKL